MKKLLYCLLCILPLGLMAQHLLLSEVVLQPSAGEYVKISNPTSGTVNLSDYYLTDATDTANGKYYYNLPDGADYWSGGGSDFIARFPDVDLPAGESLILGLGTTADYTGEYGSAPDLSLRDDMLQAASGVTTIGVAPSKLDNVAETLVLFTWDGSAATVTDVDYLLWGSLLCAVDKSGVATYAADTPAGSQIFAPVHVDGEKLARVSDTEGTETQAGGNGIDGDDETSENLNVTWEVQDLASSKPVISNVSILPDTYYITDTLTVSAVVTDEQGGLSVDLVYTFDGSQTVEEMAVVSGDTFSCEILPLDAEGTLTYYIRAENSAGLKDSTLIASVNITEEADILTIRDIRDNYDDYDGETVTVTGVVTVEYGKISSYSGYMQDESGRGLNVYGSAFSGYARGRRLSVTGEMTLYNDIVELSSTSVTDLGPGTLPEPLELTCEQIGNSFEEYEGTLVNVHGLVTSRTDYETASNVYIDDGTGSTTLRIWTSTGVLADNTADSLLQSGTSVDVDAICSFYNGAAQVLPAYAEDVSAWQDGEPGDSTFGLTVAPYPFVPKLGEVISYSYKYPEDVRVTLRVYDAAGRHITTLVEKYHGMSWQYESSWNGKDDLGRYVRPGMYIMHLEMIERTTGIRRADAKPVVVAVTN